MKFLKCIGYFLLCVLIAAVIFAAVVGIVSLCKGIGFYDVLVEWFGHNSRFGGLFG